MTSCVTVGLRVPPRLAVVPDADFSDVDEALEVAGLMGIELDDWQEFCLRASLGRRSGRWSAVEVGWIVSRQSGKGGLLEVRAVTGATRLDEELTMWTAHEYKTAREAFLRVKNGCEGSERLMDESVLKFRTANGEESVEFRNGARIRFLARTAGSGRGFSGDDVILDEAYKVTGEQMAALMPTLAARPDAQIHYASMAGLADSAYLRSVRARAEAGDEELCWLEWSAPEDADLDDEAVWQAANPAMPHRISVEFVRRERATLTDEDFARERLCIWSTGVRQPVIDPDVWQALHDPRSRPSGPVVLAVDVPPEGKRTSIARAGLRSDDRVHGEVDSKAGTAWAISRLCELAGRRKATVVLDGSSRAVALVPGLIAGGVKPVVLSTRQIVAACGAFMDLVDEGRLRHVGQPELNVAVDAARKRKVGDAWAWHRRDADADISPLVALTLAAHQLAVEGSKRKTGRMVAA